MQVLVQEIINTFGLEMMPADTTFTGLIVWFVMIMTAICATFSMVKFLVYIAINSRRLVG